MRDSTVNLAYSYLTIHLAAAFSAPLSFSSMYSSMTLTMCTKAKIRDPKANDPRWYLTKQNISFMFKNTPSKCSMHFRKYMYIRPTAGVENSTRQLVSTKNIPGTSVHPVLTEEKIL